MPCPLKAAFDQAHPTFYLPVAVVGVISLCAPHIYIEERRKSLIKPYFCTK